MTDEQFEFNFEPKRIPLWETLKRNDETDQEYGIRRFELYKQESRGEIIIDKSKRYPDKKEESATAATEKIKPTEETKPKTLTPEEVAGQIKQSKIDRMRGRADLDY